MKVYFSSQKNGSAAFTAFELPGTDPVEVAAEVVAAMEAIGHTDIEEMTEADFLAATAV